MSKDNNLSASFIKGLYLLVSGAGVGWLIGLSVSPVIYIVITSLIAFVVSITSALAGINIDQGAGKDDDARPSRRRKLQVEVNPLPMMFMIIGLVLGASLGVFARTNNWLGPNPGKFAEQWKDTELSKKELSRRLFDGLYPPRTGTVTPDENAASNEDIVIPPESKRDAEDGNQASPGGKSKETNVAGQSKAKSEASTEGGEPSKSGDIYKSAQGVLFTASSEECSRFRAARDEVLKDELTSSSDARLRQEAERCRDAGCLKKLVEAACPKSRSR